MRSVGNGDLRIKVKIKGKVYRRKLVGKKWRRRRSEKKGEVIHDEQDKKSGMNRVRNRGSGGEGKEAKEKEKQN